MKVYFVAYNDIDRCEHLIGPYALRRSAEIALDAIKTYDPLCMCGNVICIKEREFKDSEEVK